MNNILDRIIYVIYTDIKKLTREEKDEFYIISKKIKNCIKISDKENERLKYFKSKI